MDNYPFHVARSNVFQGRSAEARSRERRPVCCSPLLFLRFRASFRAICSAGTARMGRAAAGRCGSSGCSIIASGPANPAGPRRAMISPRPSGRGSSGPPGCAARPTAGVLDRSSAPPARARSSAARTACQAGSPRRNRPARRLGRSCGPIYARLDPCRRHQPHPVAEGGNRHRAPETPASRYPTRSCQPRPRTAPSRWTLRRTTLRHFDAAEQGPSTLSFRGAHGCGCAGPRTPRPSRRA